MRSLCWIVCLLLVAGCSGVPGPSAEPESAPAVKTLGFTGEYTKKLGELDIPSSWKKAEGEVPFDLQVTSAGGERNTGVFFYHRDEFQEGTDLKRALELQVEDLAGKRDEWKLEEELETIELPGKSVATTAYSGKRNGRKFFYKFSAVEFEKHKDVLVTALQVAFPDDWAEAKPVLTDIVKSVRVKETKPKPSASPK